MNTAPATGDQIRRGVMLRCLSVLCFSVMSASLKLAGQHGVVAAEMLFYRAAFGLPVVLGWVLIGPGLRALGTRRPRAHLGRTALGMSSILCTFQALILLPLADAITIGFTAPVFATVLSFLLLHERVGPHRWLAVIAGFVGVVIVMRPGGSGHEVPIAGVLVGLVAALGTAGVTVTLRQLGGTEHVAAIVFWFFTGSALVGGALLPVFGSAHDAGTLVLLAIGGVSGGFAQITMTGSLRWAPVSVLSPFDYGMILGATAFGLLLFGTWPTVNTLAGALLIGGSGLYTAWREHRLRRDRPLPPSQPAG